MSGIPNAREECRVCGRFDPTKVDIAAQELIEHTTLNFPSKGPANMHPDDWERFVQLEHKLAYALGFTKDIPNDY